MRRASCSWAIVTERGGLPKWLVNHYTPPCYVFQKCLLQISLWRDGWVTGLKTGHYKYLGNPQRSCRKRRELLHRLVEGEVLGLVVSDGTKESVVIGGAVAGNFP
jgi:hypothetical protein